MENNVEIVSSQFNIDEDLVPLESLFNRENFEKTIQFLMTITFFARPLWMHKYAHLIILLAVYGLGLWTYYETAFGTASGMDFN